MSKKKRKRKPTLVRLEVFFFGTKLNPIPEDSREVIELVKMATHSASKTEAKSIWKLPRYTG